ncbi:chorismate synthase, partial [Helicobacter bizzozeronii]|uniref:chorismate synthase n=1 Tax=Helicobacter bizzozeronii TaxID=56877 RepID=UPI0013152A46
VIRVGAGAIAKLLLQELGLEVVGGVFSIGGIEAKVIDFDFAKQSVIFSLSPEMEAQQKQAILEAKQKGDSLGGVVLVQARAHANLLGLGQPLYDKLDARIAGVMMGLNGVKGVFIGDPLVSGMQGSHYNDPISPQGFKSNHSGGVLGGLGNGSDLVVWVHFKPTSSISTKQESINTQGQAMHLELKGRHDPCIAIRGSVVCESLLALILADFLLLNLGSQLGTLKGFYGKA